MSKYIRDDKQFREQVAKLANAGLRFPTNVEGGFARPASAEDFVPSRLVNPEEQAVRDLVTKRLADKAAERAQTIDPPTKRGHFNLPGLVAGLIWWSPFIAVGIVLIHWLLGGAH